MDSIGTKFILIYADGWGKDFDRTVKKKESWGVCKVVVSFSQNSNSDFFVCSPFSTREYEFGTRVSDQRSDWEILWNESDVYDSIA